ncbi:MAG: hypothetical protein PHD82_09705 [Candidatus Riflebacteria bacterium]|nr:hypothetical protein [Candidatus Riflebacteria bacterium]
MLDDHRLIEKLRKIQALYDKGVTEGEKNAALAAMQRIKEHMLTAKPKPQIEEIKFTFDNSWSRNLFIALLRRHKIEPYRRPRQKKVTIMAKMTTEYCDNVLWPEFLALNKELVGFINQATAEIIKKAVNPDLSEPTEREN